MNIQEIHAKLKELEYLLNSEDDDEVALESALQAYLETEEDFKEKINKYCWVVERLRNESDYLEKQEKRFYAKKKSVNRKIEQLKNRLMQFLPSSEKSEVIKLKDFQIRTGNSISVIIEDEENLPHDFVEVITERKPNKVKLKAFLKAEGSKSYAYLKEQKYIVIS
jgi:DNA repair exonuclease SbcCD ATPase subunit